MQSMSAPAAASPAAQGPRILVVDDDPDIRELLCDYLRASGMRPAAVGDGQAMWDWLGRHAADLIVLCLLYTSPSPRDQRGSRMPSSA